MFGGGSAGGLFYSPTAQPPARRRARSLVESLRYLGTIVPSSFAASDFRPVRRSKLQQGAVPGLALCRRPGPVRPNYLDVRRPVHRPLLPPHVRYLRRIPPVFRPPLVQDEPPVPVPDGLPRVQRLAERPTLVGGQPPPAPQALGHGR